MLENDNRWKERFDADLTDESWLDSPSSTYSELESMIFDEEKEEKVVWWPRWVMGLIGVLFIGMLVWFAVDRSIADKTSGNNETSSTSKVELNSDEINSINDLQNQKLRKQDELVSQEVLVNAKEEIEVSSNSLPESAASISSSSSSKSKIQTSQLYQGSRKSIVEQQNNFISAPSIKSKSLPSLFNASAKNETSKINAYSQITSLSLLKMLRQGLVYNSERIFPLEEKYLPIDLENQTRTLKNELEFGAGYSMVSYKLNQNFRSAVDLADFTNSLGKGYYVTASYRHFFNDILSISFGADFVTNELMSGHNSNQTFAGDEEQEELEILMATPLGFMTGEVSVAYTGQEPENTAFVIDLENSHRYYNLDLQSTLGIQLFNTRKYRAGIDLGIGWQRIFNLDNRMDSYLVDQDVLSVDNNASVTQDQSTLNKSMLFSTMGARLDYVLTHRSSIGLSYRLQSGLNQIHQQNDLGTDIVKHKLGLSFRLRF